MKDIKLVVDKMTRNCRKMIEKTAVSLLCPLHSIQFSPLWSLIAFFLTHQAVKDLQTSLIQVTLLKKLSNYPKISHPRKKMFTFFLGISI